MVGSPRLPPGQEVVWEQLCEAASAFVVDFRMYAWAAYDAEPLPAVDFWRWIEEAEDQLWRGGTSRHTSRPSLIYEWWAERVGAHQAKKAIRFWQQRAAEPEDPEDPEDPEVARVRADIPGMLVNGRFDFQAPIGNAWALNRVWSRAELWIVDDAGHSADNESITSALVRATDHFAGLGEKP